MIESNKYGQRFWPFPFFVLVAGLVLGAAVRFLWNAILPSLLDVKPISYWQAVGLLALCRILLGNFGGRSMGQRGHWAQWKNGNVEDDDTQFSGGPPWRRKWMNMSDDDRTKFKEEMKRRCGKPPRSE